MKKIIVIALLALVIQKWDSISLFFTTPPPVADSSVVLFSTQWCGYCQRTREILKQYKVTFEEKDIEKSSIAQKQFKALGGRGVPVLVVNGKTIHGFNESEIVRLVKKL